MLEIRNVLGASAVSQFIHSLEQTLGKGLRKLQRVTISHIPNIAKEFIKIIIHLQTSEAD